ncbi:MAG: Hsp20/alpha crystallin family protein [Chloroflexi bacterium]|nr:Hsp20/alpha crystallin family protein [Chloroflexota bacterium]MCY4248509.1 Hsp20/alpha crystallin family protein [Chloroflexota bacterium]
MTNEPRFHPLRDIQHIGEQITRQVEKGIRAVTSSPEHLPVDMYEADGHIYICTQSIDGLVKDSIDISLEANILTISLRTEPEPTPTSARFLLQERRFGPITREIELSVPVKAQEARAKVESGGRLLISLPINTGVYGNITVTPVE